MNEPLQYALLTFGLVGGPILLFGIGQIVLLVFQCKWLSKRGNK
jgi:hypothetical protein